LPVCLLACFAVVKDYIVCVCSEKVILVEFGGWMSSFMRTNQPDHRDSDDVKSPQSWIIFYSSDHLSGCIIENTILHPSMIMENILVCNHCSNDTCALNLSMHLRFHSLSSIYCFPATFVE